MRLTPWEEERLLVFTAAELARRHRSAGLALNAPEAIALICDAMFEAARAGATYADVEAAGRAAVAPDDVMASVRELVDDVRLEVLMDDGVRLIVLVDPLGRPDMPADGPGAVRLAARETSPRTGADTVELEVSSTSRRAIRVSSHFPFHRVNPRLEFDREAAKGYRLDVEAGESVRWGPRETRTVRLVRFRGEGGEP
jgi:urease subunit gamma/beta